MGKKKSVPNRQQAHVKRENKFIDMPKEKLIKICVIVGVVILAIVLFFVLRRTFDGHLPVQDGVVVTQADNWIVANTESSNSPRYFKLGAVGEVEGYTRVRDETLVSDANTAPYTYTPEDEASPIQSITVMSGSGAYDQLASNVHANLPMYMTNIQMTEIDEIDVGGVPARSFGYTYNYENTVQSTASEGQEAGEGQEAAQGQEAGEGQEATASTTYVSGYYIYLRAGHGRSVVVSAGSQAQDEATVATVEQLRAEAEKVAAQLQID